MSLTITGAPSKGQRLASSCQAWLYRDFSDIWGRRRLDNARQGWQRRGGTSLCRGRKQYQKPMQHLEGGIIGEILVRENELVSRTRLCCD